MCCSKPDQFSAGSTDRPVSVRLHMKIYTFVFRCVRSAASPLLCNIFPLCSASSPHSTRTLSQSHNGWVLPPVSSCCGLHYLSILAANRWNALPREVCSAESSRQFRSSILDWPGGYPVRRHQSLRTVPEKYECSTNKILLLSSAVPFSARNSPAMRTRNLLYRQLQN